MKTYKEKEQTSFRLDLLKETIEELVFANGLIESPEVLVYYACLNEGYMMDKLPPVEVLVLKNHAENCLSQV